MAFLDAAPVKLGHTLVIPRKHTEEVLSLSEEEYVHLMTDVRAVAKKMKAFFNVPRVAIIVEGMSVGHVHVHLIPIYKSGDLAAFNKYDLQPGESEKLANELRTVS